MENSNFNENETKVLKALAEEMKNYTNGEFGYMGDAKRGEFSKHEFAGYVGSIFKKGAFEYLDNTSGEDYEGQFALKEEIYEAYKPQA